MIAAIHRLRESISNRKIENASLDRQIEQKSKDCNGAILQVDIAKEAAEFVDMIATTTRVSTKHQFETLITSALQQVYDPLHSFEMEWTFKRDRPAIDFFIHHGAVRRNIDDGNGEGVNDLVSTVLRILVASLVPSVPRVLVLDEPGKHLDEDRSSRFGEFLSKLCDQLDWQIIAVTHSSALAEHASASYQIHHDGIMSIVSSDDRIPTTGFFRSARLQNFESHVDSRIDFARGLTVLCGPSNSGKTSILRGLQLACYGRWSPDAVRIGESFARVELLTERGIVAVERGKTRNVWEMTLRDSAKTTTLKNVGRGVPDEAVAIHGIAPVKLGGKDVPIHFASQRESAFLISAIGSQDASAGTVAKLFDSLTGLEGLEELSASIAKHKSQFQVRARNLQEQIEETEKLKYDVDVLQCDSNRLDEIDSVLTGYDKAKFTHDELFSLLEGFTAKESTIEDIAQSLEFFDGLPALEKEAKEAGELFVEYEKILSLHKKNMNLEGQKRFIIGRLKVIPDEGSAEQLVLQVHDNLSDLDKIVDMNAQRAYLEASLASFDAIMEGNNTMIESSELVFAEWKDSIKTCPYCEQPLHNVTVS